MPKELEILKEVNGIQIENLKNEVSLFCNRVKKLSNQIKNVDDFQLNNLKDFIDVNFFVKSRKKIEFKLLFFPLLRNVTRKHLAL